MPQNPSRHSKTVVAHDSSEEYEEKGVSKSSTGGGNIVRKAHELMINNQKRRDTQRKTIATDHDQRVKVTREKINKLFIERTSRVTKSHREMWQRLHDLNKRREALEARIIASMKHIEKQTSNIHNEMAVVFEGRIKDIEEPDED